MAQFQIFGILAFPYTSLMSIIALIFNPPLYARTNPLDKKVLINLAMINIIDIQQNNQGVFQVV